MPTMQEKWKKSGLSWLEWRRKEVTDYMAQVSERVRDRAKKKFVIGVLPDPVTSYERFGINFDDLAPLTDEFLVVMFSKNYATPWYWEMLTRAFKKTIQRSTTKHLTVRVRSRRRSKRSCNTKRTAYSISPVWHAQASTTSSTLLKKPLK